MPPATPAGEVDALVKPDESDENSAAAAEALVADTERRTQAWLAARDEATAAQQAFDLDITSGLTGAKVATVRVTRDETIEQLKAQIAQKTAERTEPDRQRIVLMSTASETGGKAQRLEDETLRLGAAGVEPETVLHLHTQEPELARARRERRRDVREAAAERAEAAAERA
eukprot:COSAG04_NODE_6427_length_1328_cov_0.995118_3_plen_170_part_01